MPAEGEEEGGSAIREKDVQLLLVTGQFFQGWFGYLSPLFLKKLKKPGGNVSTRGRESNL